MYSSHSFSFFGFLHHHHLTIPSQQFHQYEKGKRKSQLNWCKEYYISVESSGWVSGGAAAATSLFEFPLKGLKVKMRKAQEWKFGTDRLAWKKKERIIKRLT